MTEIVKYQTHKITGRKIKIFYDSLIEGVKDIETKLKYLRDSAPENGLAIARYPSGTPLKILQKITNILKNKPILAGFHYMEIKTSHGFMFHLAKNGSVDHKNFETYQSRTGGLKSDIIEDFGDFLIVEIKDGYADGEGADFSLYRTEEGFQI